MIDPEEILDYHLPDGFLSGIDCDQTKNKCGAQFGERSRRHSPVGGSRPYSDNSPHDVRRRHDEPSASKGIKTFILAKQNQYVFLYVIELMFEFFFSIERCVSFT